MKYVIGVDGGGTKTKLVLYNLNKELLSGYISGPSNILSSGYDIAKQSITEVLMKGVVERGYKLEECQALCIGVAGAGRENIKEQIKQIIRECGYSRELIITHDAETALMGATNGKKGILIIAGTGAICYGQNDKGDRHRVSGWGHIIGDEGSAYSIGRDIINSVMREYDGRGQATYLTPLLLEAMQLTNPEEIITAIYAANIMKQDIAAYAILLDRAIKVNDTVALEILKKSVNDNVEAVAAVIRKLELEETAVDIIVSGSVLVNNQRIKNEFIHQLKIMYPKAKVKDMINDASYGAMLIALQSYKSLDIHREEGYEESIVRY